MQYVLLFHIKMKTKTNTILSEKLINPIPNRRERQNDIINTNTWSSTFLASYKPKCKFNIERYQFKSLLKNKLLTRTEFSQVCNTKFSKFYIRPIMCIYALSSVVWCPLWFPYETMFGSYLPPVVCRRVHVLFALCVFVYILCFVYV